MWPRAASLAAFLIAAAAIGFAFGGAEPDNERGVPLGEPVEITGRVRRVGAEPFSSLVITDDEAQDWHVLSEWESVVAGFEQREVTVRAIVSRRKMELADGTELAPRWELSEVELIETP
jgi:hypothetical protein